MELQNVLQQRRSIRKYKQQPVEKEKIEDFFRGNDTKNRNCTGTFE